MKKNQFFTQNSNQMKAILMCAGLMLAFWSPFISFGQMESPDVTFQEAEFPGGSQALHKHFKKHLKYPITAREEGISGRFQVFFTVLPTGEVTGIRIAEGLGVLFDNAVAKAFKSMPDWMPAVQGNRPVESERSIIFRFNLLKG